MAPSSTKGAVTRLLRNAAINVTVFQFPCSTFWTSRSPCGARPYRRVIVVDTLVSSMNTSLLGSSLFCRRCNALRAAATSGRSCSAARKLFFKGQLQMMQKPRDRRLSDRDLFLRQSIFEFGQRDVRLLRYQLPHQILVRRQREIFIAAEFGRVDAARLPVKLEEADDRADADPALLRGFRDRGPALDRLDHTPTQIRRIWLRHSCRPPPSRKLESYSRRYGNPRFSLSGKRSNRRLQPLRYLHDCSDCFRLERLPGGICTHWKAPPLHGAHPSRTSDPILPSQARCAATFRASRTSVGECGSIRFPVRRSAKTIPVHDPNPSRKRISIAIFGPERLLSSDPGFEDRPVDCDGDMSSADDFQAARWMAQVQHLSIS